MSKLQQQEILVEAVGKASKLVPSSLSNQQASDRRKSPHKVVDPFTDYQDNSELIDENATNNQEYEKLAKQLSNSVVFMDSVSAECFSWNQFGEDKSLTSNHLLKLGVLTILDLTSDQDWPSLDKIKDLKEMNSSWNNYLSNNDKTDNSKNNQSHNENDSEEEDDEFEKFYSDEEDEAPTVNTKQSTMSESSERVEHFIIQSDMIEAAQDTSNVQKAVFFVCHLTKTLEQAVRKSVEKYKFTHLYFYSPFSEGFCEYYQSKVLEGVEMDENYVPSVGYFKEYLTYSDLIEKCRLIIFETQYNLHKKENSSKRFENEINNSIHVEVNHYSFNISAILPNIFVTPTCHSVFPILPLSQKPATLSTPTKASGLLSGFTIGSPQKEKKSEVLMAFDELPTPFQLQFKMLAATLRDLLKNMRMSVDVYSLGQSSNLIAQDLQNLIREESFRTTNSCTLVLVDRSLDLVSPMVHSESILDKVLNAMERKTGLSTNVRFDGMTLNSFSSEFKKLNMSGLLHHGNEKIINVMNSIIEKKNSESIGEMKVILDKLQNLTTKKGELSLEKTTQSLKNLLKELSFSVLSDNCDIIQFLSTIIHALEQTHTDTKRAELASAEKLILYECDNNQDELLSYIINILKKDGSKFSLQDLLRLIVMIYSVVVPDCFFRMERDLKKLLAKHIIDNYKQSSCVSFIESILSDETLDQLQNPTEEASPAEEEEEDEEDWDNWNEDFDDDKPKKKFDIQENISNLVEEDLSTLFKCLNAIKRQRQYFQILDKLAANDHVFIFENESGNLGNTETPFRSLCKQLTYVLGETEPCPDLVHNASLLSTISNTFGFMFQSKSKPIKNESSTMILFIVGGITFGEITDIKQMINNNLSEKGQHSPYFGKKIILGSTCITSPEIILNHLFSH